MVLIEINHLVKKYGEHVAVDDLTLTVEPGKIYGFLGPNGAGKSTTMNMITGYLGATVTIFLSIRTRQKNAWCICRRYRRSIRR